MRSGALADINDAFFDFDIDGIADKVKVALSEGAQPSEITDVLLSDLKKVGENYEKGELFLPDMVGAAGVVQNALPILQDAMSEKGETRDSLGVALIGTVSGDIHTIGKSMVAAMMVAEGFDVIDLGINVSTEAFVNAVKEHKPAILGMSALLTTTAPAAKAVIDALNSEGLRDGVKIIFGGGAVTEELARSYGADGYEDTAPGAAKVARMLVGK